MNAALASAAHAVRKTVTVAAPIALAFEVFTARIESWWPMASHHIGDADCAAVVIEPHVGGRWYERGTNGVECVWGQVQVGSRRGVSSVWQLDAQFKFDPTLHTEVDVRFTAIDDRTTQVDLEHRGPRPTAPPSSRCARRSDRRTAGTACSSTSRRSRRARSSPPRPITRNLEPARRFDGPGR